MRRFPNGRGLPPFDLCEKAHGRHTTRRISLKACDPLDVLFPHVRTVIHVGRFTEGKHKASTWENAYYLSSREPNSMPPVRWLQTIRDHWAGCEIRNHWRKDACLFEDKTRSRNPHLVANLMLLRNLALHVYVHHAGLSQNLNDFVETMAATPKLAFLLLHATNELT